MSAHEQLYQTCSLSVQARRGRRLLWVWSYRWLCTAMWLLQTKPRSSARPLSHLDHWVIPNQIIFQELECTSCLFCVWLENALLMGIGGIRRELCRYWSRYDLVGACVSSCEWVLRLLWPSSAKWGREPPASCLQKRDPPGFLWINI